MNLTEQIADFKDMFGRDTLSNARVTRLLNQASSFLESKFVGKFAKSWVMLGLPSGYNMLRCSHLMHSIEEIYYMDPTGSLSNGRAYVAMNKYPNFFDFIQEHSSQGGSGTPTDYILVGAPYMHLGSEMVTVLDAGEGWTSEMFESGEALNVLFNCKASQRIDLRIYGERRVRTLSDGSDTNYFTVNNPILLNHAAAYMLELTMKQYQEAAQMLAIVDTLIAEVDIKSVGVEADELGNQIEG